LQVSSGGLSACSQHSSAILVLSNQVLVRMALAAALEQAGMRVIPVADAPEALEVLDAVMGLPPGG
jgi:CheY-like chemotaxis protein